MLMDGGATLEKIGSFGSFDEFGSACIVWFCQGKPTTGRWPLGPRQAHSIRSAAWPLRLYTAIAAMQPPRLSQSSISSSIEVSSSLYTPPPTCTEPRSRCNSDANPNSDANLVRAENRRGTAAAAAAASACEFAIG